MGRPENKQEHIDHLCRNAEVKIKEHIYWVCQGTAGNRTLGSVDYLNSHGEKVEIISRSKFQNI
jgi:hypothetical protein